MDLAHVFHMTEKGVYQDGKLISEPIKMTPEHEAAMQNKPKGCDACELDNPNLPHHGCRFDSFAMSVSKHAGGRPRGFDGTRCKMPSALAQAFKRAGLDWREDFALAIKANKRDRIKLWLKLLPYLITTQGRSKVRKWKGRPSKAALIALETLEGKGE